MNSINDFFFKIKHKIGNSSDEILLVVVILLVAITAFGLGRLSANAPENSPAILTKKASTSTPADIPQDEVLRHSLSGAVITSKNGTAYHLPWCPGAKRIDPENIQWFKTPKQAKEAGYRPAKNCKGLGSDQ